ncbi:hypothetical protein C7S18_02605 [Ahniella affigens]|uniref:Uncharacterized protein n=2 Tax=Ahniella affigens TaxID=2021234 RepID=A0A2P1PMS5_9GAMM|nr:hypothetical protein C7S18_02605 [Ahniella affigens]
MKGAPDPATRDQAYRRFGHRLSAWWHFRLQHVVIVCCCLISSGLANAGSIDSAFADGFENRIAGTLIAGSQEPAPGAVRAADSRPTISATFIAFAGANIPALELLIDGQVVDSVVVGADSFSWTPSQALPEGNHVVEVRIGAPPQAIVSTWTFRTATPPRIFGIVPAYEVIAPATPVSVTARFEDIGSGIDPATARIHVDGIDQTAAATITPAELTLPNQVFAAGAHELFIQVDDLVGNRSQVEVPIDAGVAPTLTALMPAPGAILTAGTEPGIDIAYDGAGLPVSAESLRLFVDGTNLSAGAALVPGSGQAGHITHPALEGLQPGLHTVFVEIAQTSGVRQTLEWQFEIAVPRDDHIAFVSPTPGTVSAAPTVEAVVRIASNRAVPRIVLVDSVPAILQSADAEGATFVAEVPLSDGLNTLTASAEFEGPVTLTTDVSISYDAPIRIALESPQDFAAFGPMTRTAGAPGAAINLSGDVARPIEIRGSLSVPVTEVWVNQQAATVVNDGRQFVFAAFFLHEGTNLLTIVAKDARGRAASLSRTVFVDQTAPIVTIESPEVDATTSSATINVRGVVNDAVEPGLLAPEVRVRVQIEGGGQVIDAMVSDRYYFAQDLQLQPGMNRILVQAEDALGNIRTAHTRIARTMVGTERLVLIDGDSQMASVDTFASRPLTVQWLDAQGNPRADQDVRFDVTRGSGTISETSTGGTNVNGAEPARNLKIRTNAEGLAQVWLRLGNEASPAGNSVRASANGVPEDVYFVATGLRGVPFAVLADGAGATQYAQTDAQPIEALVAVVLDAQYNRIIGTPVRFRIESGSARFLPHPNGTAQPSPDGQEIDVQTDKNGLAAVRPMIGAAPGLIQISAEAVMLNAPSVGRADFQIVAEAPQSGATGFSGVVMDHTGTPLSDVRVSITRTNLTTLTDALGRFAFESDVPAGKIDLQLDGRLTPAPAGQEFPNLHFETAIVPGRMNQLPHGIYLPPINAQAAQIVGGDADVRLTIPGFDGFELLVKKHSVTFPDGAREGRLVVSPVHNDRLPMVPPGGSAAFGTVGWTIQPSGTRFDPPAEVTIPSPGGMRPGETVQIVQWDHDLATFVPMGQGTVSEDAARITTDPGAGITKAGWGGCIGPDCPPDPGNPNCGEFNPLGCNVNACMKIDSTGSGSGCPRCVPKEPQEVNNTLLITNPGPELGPAPELRFNADDITPERHLFDIDVINLGSGQYFLQLDWFAESETEIQVRSANALKCKSDTDHQPMEQAHGEAQYQHFYIQQTGTTGAGSYFKATTARYGFLPITNATDATVHVTACGLDEVDKNVPVTFRLENPGAAAVRTYLGQIESDAGRYAILDSIACHEPALPPNPAYSQFRASGLPVLNGTLDGGVGMFQITGAGMNNCDTLWDWRANARAGRDVFLSKLNSGIVRNYHLQEPNGHSGTLYPNVPLQQCLARTGETWSAIARPLTDAQKLRAALKFYNGGREFEWVLTPTPAGQAESCARGTWVENPSRVRACQLNPSHSSCHYVESVLACPASHP